MRITIFDLDLLTYETLKGYFSDGWCEYVVDRGTSTISVRIGENIKLTLAGDAVILEYMGRMAIVDRNHYFYIKIE